MAAVRPLRSTYGAGAGSSHGAGSGQASDGLFGSAPWNSPQSRRPQSAPARCRPREAGRGMLSHPGALSWIYAQPEVEAKRSKAWLRSVSNPEMKLRMMLKRPLEKEMPTETNNGTNFRLNQLVRMKKLIDKASSLLPVDDPLLRAGRNRMERIRGLPLDPPQPPLSPEELAAQAEMEAAEAEEERKAAEAEEKARMTQITRKAPQFAKTCECGHVFGVDSYICRNCGLERKEIVDEGMAVPGACGSEAPADATSVPGALTESGESVIP